MFAKFIQTVKLKYKNEEKLIKAGTVMDLPKSIIEILSNKNKIIKLHPEINENCVKPFICELIENDECVFIKLNIKTACLGPYHVTEDGEIISYLKENQ